MATYVRMYIHTYVRMYVALVQNQKLCLVCVSAQKINFAMHAHARRIERDAKYEADSPSAGE